MVKLACVAALMAASLSAPAAQAVTFDQLRNAVAASAHAAPAQQHISFGPMKDGRQLFIITKSVNNSFSVYIDPDKMGNYTIFMGRELPLYSLYIVDATLICARLPRGGCDRMSAYILRVSQSPSPASAPSLEEAFPEYREAAQATRADDQVYRASMLAGLQSMTLMLTLHEIGHAALHHTDHKTSNPEILIDQEGEADGFASYVADAGGAQPAGAAFPLLLDAVEENTSGVEPAAHPLAICRASIMTKEGIEIVRDHQDELGALENDEQRGPLMKCMLERLSKAGPLDRINGERLNTCKSYITSFSIGFEKARMLVDQNTKIDSNIPGQP